MIVTKEVDIDINECDCEQYIQPFIDSRNDSLYNLYRDYIDMKSGRLNERDFDKILKMYFNQHLDVLVR